MQPSGWLCLVPVVLGAVAGTGKQRALPQLPMSLCSFSHPAASSKQPRRPALKIRRDLGSSSPDRETAPGAGEILPLPQGQLQSPAVLLGLVYSILARHHSRRSNTKPGTHHSSGDQRAPNEAVINAPTPGEALQKGRRDSKRRLFILIPWD